MRRWRYVEPDEKDFDKEKVVDTTEEEIIQDFYPRWCELMKQKFGSDVPLDQGMCIEDWVSVHWAWEIKEND